MKTTVQNAGIHSKTMLTMCIIGSILVLCVPYPLQGEHVSEIRHTVRFSQSDVQISTFKGYDAIYMQGTRPTGELGKPVLPTKSVMLALPSGTRAVSIKAIPGGSVHMPGDFTLQPAQSPLPVGQSGADVSVKPDPDVYASRAYYPGYIATLDNQGNIAGQQIAWVTVYPVQYKPALGKLILHTEIELSVQCVVQMPVENTGVEHYQTFTDNQRSLYAEMIRTLVANPGQVNISPYMGRTAPMVPAGTYDHVIITSSALAPYFQPLAFWHTRKGLKDTIVTTEWIYDNYTGADDTCKIREFVIDAHTNWGTMYFLMGGEMTIVPCSRREYYGGNTQNAPSDQYYSDFDDDMLHEVFVGRASVDNTEQVTLFVDKVLAYEKNPPLTDFATEVLLAGFDLDYDTPAELAKDSIATFIPDYFDKNKVYDSHGGNHRDSVLYYLNQGQNVMNHDDHGNEEVMTTGWTRHHWEITIHDVDNLTNYDRTTIVVSMGCECNAHDTEDCIAEHFVLYNERRAGVAFIGNTRHGWYYQGNPFALSSELDLWLWHGMFTLEYDLGQALVYSKNQFPTEYAWDYACEWNFNLQGEPAMPIWTDNPAVMVVDHDPVVPNDPGDFIVRVMEEDGITPVQDAQVCCWIPKQVPGMHVIAYTDAAGEARVSVTPTTPGDTMMVTVTKKNYVCHEGEAEVIDPDDPFIRATTTVLFENAGNGDGIVNPGERFDYAVWAENFGYVPAYRVYGVLTSPDPYAAVNQGTRWYGDIMPGDSAVSMPPFRFTVANNCPNQHTVVFDLDYYDMFGANWLSHPKVTVYAPVLIYEDVAVVDDENPDETIEPGETGDLVVTLVNEGDATAPAVIGLLASDTPGITIHDALGTFGDIEPGASGDNTGDHFTVTADSTMPDFTEVQFSLAVQAGVYAETLAFTLTVARFVPTDSQELYHAYYSGGPHVHAPVFEWIAIDSTQSQYPGTSLDLNDSVQTVKGILLPFGFPYYGSYRYRLGVCAHGWVRIMRRIKNDSTNSGIPDEDGPGSMVAGVWDYLRPGVPDASGDVYYYYDEPNHRFIVEFFQVEHYPSGDPETFEIILYDPVYYPTPTGDGEIVIQYLTAPKQTDITIGIENYGETDGIQYYYNGEYHRFAGEFTDSFAIKLTTHSPASGARAGTQSRSSRPGNTPVQTRMTAFYPNPFSRSMQICYQVASRHTVQLFVYDAVGRRIRTLENGVCEPGYHSATWDGYDDAGRTVPAGVYFVSFESDDYQKVSKAILLR